MCKLLCLLIFLLSFNFEAQAKKKHFGPESTTSSSAEKASTPIRKRKRATAEKDGQVPPIKKAKQQVSLVSTPELDTTDEDSLKKKEPAEEDPNSPQIQSASPLGLGDLSVLPPGPLSHIATFISPLDTLNLGLANSQTKNTYLNDAHTLLKSLNYQLSDTIHALFKVTPTTISIKRVNQKTLSFHIRRLMEMLRLLNDHAYYDITDAAYQTALIALRTTEEELWGPGALNTIYLKAKQVRIQDYDVIHILLGQILNHLDGKNRTFEIAFHDVLTCEAAVIVNSKYIHTLNALSIASSCS